MTNVDYKVLKACIIKSCSPKFKHSLSFKIDFDKLVEEVGAMNLVPVYVGLNSKLISPEDIGFIGEYYEKERLEWFSNEKEFTVLTFVDKDGLDEEGKYLLRKIKQKQVDDPDDDKVNDFAKILARYFCYNALVVSYRYKVDEETTHEGRTKEIYIPSYAIMCRANKVVIKNSNYQYNPHDFS